MDTQIIIVWIYAVKTNSAANWGYGFYMIEDNLSELESGSWRNTRVSGFESIEKLIAKIKYDCKAEDFQNLDFVFDLQPTDNTSPEILYPDTIRCRFTPQFKISLLSRERSLNEEERAEFFKQLEMS